MPSFIDCPLEGVIEIHPTVLQDSRGYFFESFRQEWLEEFGIQTQWKQDNESFSIQGTLRGLHFQHPPHAQAKLVRVIQGRVLDVVLDLRQGSATFGHYHSVVLDSDRHNLLHVPAGFAHGFCALEDSLFHYKCSDYYNFQSESGIHWADPNLQIDWQITDPIVSDKDQKWPTLEEFKARVGGL